MSKALGVFLTALLVPALVLAWPGIAAADVYERGDLGYYTLAGADGAEVLLTGLMVSVGDGFIAEDNREYRVVGIDGNTATVELVGTVDLGIQAELPGPPVEDSGDSGDTASWWLRFLAWEPLTRSTQVSGAAPRVAIYHTHNDESYVPSDGKASIVGEGGVVKVGAALKRELEKVGVDAVHDITSHYPHDASAYQRSRRTASKLLDGSPDLVLDVHRDTTPPRAYRRIVNGKTVTQIMLVVGRQNPRGSQTDALAKKIKAVVDRNYPGLIRGIYYARGNYNQDLSDRLILAEVGAYENHREYAEAGIQFFANAIPDIVAALGGPQGTLNRRAGRAWIWLVILVLAGGLGYLLLSTGSLKEAASKVRGLGGREWGDLRGKKRPDSDGPDA